MNEQHRVLRARAPEVECRTRTLEQLGLDPGPWLQAVKNLNMDDNEHVNVGGRPYPLGELRRTLLVSSPGESIAYLTDFRLNSESEDQLFELIRGCTTVVCENNFCNADRHLAAKSLHLVSADVAQLASHAKIHELVLIHLSDRYDSAAWMEQLAEVRAGFPAADFPKSWQSTMVRQPQS